MRRRIASNATIPDTTSRVIPLPAADSNSARFQPNVHAPRAGRAARRIAQIEARIAPTSDSMCPTSDSSASEPDTTATTTSVTMKPASSVRAMTR